VYFERAMKRMLSGKYPGPDDISDKLIQQGGLLLKRHVFGLILIMWESEQVPKDLNDAFVITIFKNGDQNACGNYHGFPLSPSW